MQSPFTSCKCHFQTQILMKKTLLLFHLLLLLFINAQREKYESRKTSDPSGESAKVGAFINVNKPEYPQSSYTIEQIIQNVLVSGVSSCAGSVSNVKVSPNIALDDGKRSWGYFNKGTTGFPFDDGIVLSTGYAKYAGNSYSYGFLKGKHYTAGDVDLSKAIAVNNTLLFDATYIEFDFVPVTNRISFSYLFASEEYTEEFACDYSDGFALLIKKKGDLNYTNMALLPGINTIFNVTNVRREYDSCPEVNPQFYAGDNDPPKETNYEGRTVPLLATANVIPGQIYHFKMVIADFGNDLGDSAIFLKGGSFNIGLNLTDGSGHILPDVLNLCPGISQVLNAEVSAPGATYQWYLDGNIIAGATTATYTATLPGTYMIEVLLPGTNCPLLVQIKINHVPNPIIQVTAYKTKICAGETAYLFASGGQLYSFSGLPGSSNVREVSPTTTTTYFVTGTSVYGCVGNTASITIEVLPPITSALADLEFCKGTDAVLDAGSGPNYTYLWNTGATTQTIPITVSGVYSVTINNGSCKKTFSATVTYIPVPFIDQVIYERNTLTIKVQNATPELEYSLSKGASWQNSNVFTNILPNMSYPVWVRVPGETCYANLDFFTFYMNNVITPNNDGINDEVDFSGVSKYKDFSAVLFDRYGKEIFRATSANPRWRANDRQARTSTATYWYQVMWTDPASGYVVQKTGWLLIKNRN